MRTLFLFLFLPFLGFGCASSTERNCRTINWQEVGLQDGSAGQPQNPRLHLTESCLASFSEVNKSQYDQAWTQGHAEFCSPAGAYRAGVRGKVLMASCSDTALPEFREQYRLGLAVHQMLAQKEELNKQIQTLNQDQSTIATLARAGAILNGRSPTGELDERKALLDEKIMAIDHNAPGGPQAASTTNLALFLEHRELLQHYTGAWFGTFLGFGIGHAIQGRYESSGWKWTIGEIATLGSIFALSSQACGERHTEQVRVQEGSFVRYESRDVCAGNGPGAPLVPLTIFTWIGFRIWQSYDLFAVPAPRLARNSVFPGSLYISQNGLQWTSSF